MLELPFTADPAYDFTVQLSEKKYTFTVRFNDRSGVWTFDLAESETKNIMLQSIPIVLGADLLGAYNFSIGSLIAVDTSNRASDATVDDLGGRVKVYWFSPDEVAAL